MNWISVFNFKADFAIARAASDAQATMAIEAAEDELITIIGQAAVTDTLLATPTDPARAARVVRAHKFLAASIHLLNVRNVKKEQDASSPAMAGKMIQNEYWTPDEIMKMRENWRNLALKAISPYLIVDDPDDDLEFEPAFETGVLTVAAADCALQTGKPDYCNDCA
jgi:hypothetical protein